MTAALLSLLFELPKSGTLDGDRRRAYAIPGNKGLPADQNSTLDEWFS